MEKQPAGSAGCFFIAFLRSLMFRSVGPPMIEYRNYTYGEEDMTENISMRERLDEAIQLREEGRAKQDQVILQQARTLLLELGDAYPDNAEITFQLAVVHDNL